MELDECGSIASLSRLNGPFARNHSCASGDHHRGATRASRRLIAPTDSSFEVLEGRQPMSQPKSNERLKLFLLDAVEIVDQRQNLGSYVSFLIVGNIDVVLGCVD